MSRRDETAGAIGYLNESVDRVAGRLYELDLNLGRIADSLERSAALAELEPVNLRLGEIARSGYEARDGERDALERRREDLLEILWPIPSSSEPSS